MSVVGMPGMGIAELSWPVRSAGAPCSPARELMSCHSCGASAARSMGVSCALAVRAVGISWAPMGVTGVASCNLSSYSWPCRPWSSIGILSLWLTRRGAL